MRSRWGVARAIVVAGLCAVAVFAGSAPAQTSERIVAFNVDITIRASGQLHVREIIDYDFGGQRKHGIFRTIPVRARFDGTHDRVYPLHRIRVGGLPGTPTETETTREGDDTKIRIGDPDRTITGRHRYVIEYDVDGALTRFANHDELYWNAVGVEWDVPIDSATATVRAETPPTRATCFTGPGGSNLPCGAARVVGAEARFSQARLPAYSGLTLVVALPAGSVAKPGPILRERWTLNRAFERTPLTVGLAVFLLVLGLGYVGRLAWRTGRDRRFRGEIPGLLPPAGVAGVEEPLPPFADPAGPVEFAPPPGMRPAMMGVLIDESADALDVTATIVDLAVRQHLRIDEKPKKWFFSSRDWTLTRLSPAPGDAPNEWERLLLDALFDEGQSVDLSALKDHFYTDLKRIQDKLYDEVMAQRWFTRRPDKARGVWFTLGLFVTGLGAVVTYQLAKRTHFGLVGLPVVLCGLVLLAVHHWMPSRTGAGSAALARALGFRRYLRTAESGQLRYEESAGVFARYLPFAVVLGETKRWARAFADLDARGQSDLYWYGGADGWNASHFADSMSDFSVATAGTIASSPSSSGFSGGSSGGGGGGGGGGSW